MSRMQLRSATTNNKGHSRSSFSSLPPEICEKVLENLDPLDLLKVSRVSQKFWHLSENSLLWRKKCKESGIKGELVNP